MSVGGLEGCFVFEITRTCEEENRDGLQESNLPSYLCVVEMELRSSDPAADSPPSCPLSEWAFCLH